MERPDKIPIGDRGGFGAWFANRVWGWRVVAPPQTRPIAIPSLRVCGRVAIVLDVVLKKPYVVDLFAAASRKLGLSPADAWNLLTDYLSWDVCWASLDVRMLSLYEHVFEVLLWNFGSYWGPCSSLVRAPHLYSSDDGKIAAYEIKKKCKDKGCKERSPSYALGRNQVNTYAIRITQLIAGIEDSHHRLSDAMHNPPSYSEFSQKKFVSFFTEIKHISIILSHSELVGIEKRRMEILSVSTTNSTALGDLCDPIWIKPVSIGYLFGPVYELTTQSDPTLQARNPVKEIL
ncbi:hypothetical protein Tco_0399974 [Tanacetum coccineum]